MPRYKVTGPDGRAFIVNAPEGATQQQVLAFARSYAPKQQPQTEKPSSFWQGVLEGVQPYGANAGRIIAKSNPITGILDAVTGLPSKAVDTADTAARETMARSPHQGSIAGKFTGAVVGSLPTALLPGGFVAQGAAGGLLGSELDDPASVALNTALGAGAGKAAQKLAPIVTRATQDIGSKIKGAAAGVTGHRPAQVMPPQPSMDVLAPGAAERAVRFEQLGVKPTTGMVTRDPNVYSFEQNAAKTAGGEDLQRQMLDVEEGLVTKGRELIEAQGGARGAEATGKAVQDVLDTKRTEMQAVTSGLYKQVRETRGDAEVGAPSWLLARLDQPDITDNPTFDAMREGIMRSLKRFGLTGDSGLARKGAVLNVNQAEELRKLIGSLGNGIEPSVRMMRRELIDALDDDVVEGLGDDAFKAARASAKARFDEFSKTFAGRLADERIPAEQVTRRVLGAGTSLKDLRAMRQSLLGGTSEQAARGQEAWRGLGAQALDDLITKSVTADGALAGSTLYREFVKNADKLKELLGSADFRTLGTLANATRDVKAFPPMHSVNTSNTAITGANMLQGLFASAPPKVREGWGRLLGKFTMRAGAHLGAAAVSPGFGNVAVEAARMAGSEAAQQRATQAAAKAFADRIRLAQNPQEAAALIADLRQSAPSDAAARQIVDYLVKAGLVGGSAAQPLAIGGN